MKSLTQRILTDTYKEYVVPMGLVCPKCELGHVYARRRTFHKNKKTRTLFYHCHRCDEGKWKTLRSLINELVLLVADRKEQGGTE